MSFLLPVGFFLFLLLNATLFIRPAEIVPALLEQPIYLVLILTCAAVVFIPVISQLSIEALRRRPITVCVVGLLAAVILSHGARLNTWEARMSGFEFAKILLYYLLLVTVVNTPGRLRWFLFWLAGFTVVLAALALLQYYGVVSIPALEVLKERDTDAITGDLIDVVRLRSTGIYNDPNDLCLILLIGIAISLYGLGSRRLGVARFLWLAPVGLFGFALMLTKSRGGLLALVASLLVLFRSRYGWGKTVVLSVGLLPVIVLLFGGRQTNIDLSSGESTGQARIQLWSEGLQLFREAPFFGIGQGEYAEEVGLVAHNSYIHAYTELGIFGGTLFVGAFFLAFLTLHRLGRRQAAVRDPELRRLRPYLLAIVTAYMVGMLTLSRCYIQPTYMVLGLATVYLRLTSKYQAIRVQCFDGKLCRQMVLVSGTVLAGFYLFVRVFARFG
jgi:O-antigen ligase